MAQYLQLALSVNTLKKEYGVKEDAIDKKSEMMHSLSDFEEVALFTINIVLCFKMNRIILDGILLYIHLSLF